MKKLLFAASIIITANSTAMSDAIKEMKEERDFFESLLITSDPEEQLSLMKKHEFKTTGNCLTAALPYTMLWSGKITPSAKKEKSPKVKKSSDNPLPESPDFNFERFIEKKLSNKELHDGEKLKSALIKEWSAYIKILNDIIATEEKSKQVQVPVINISPVSPTPSQKNNGQGKKLKRTVSDFHKNFSMKKFLHIGKSKTDTDIPMKLEPIKVVN